MSTTTLPSPCTAVLLDLDGTITDSAPAILTAMEATLVQLGLPAQSREELMRYVGPPLAIGFATFAGLTGEANSHAVECYRSHYEKVMCDAPLYDGIADFIATVKAAGLPLALATSKNEHLSRLIVDHHGLLDSFDVVSGAGDDAASGTKAAVMRSALQRLDMLGADLSGVVHVGDREHDVEGASECDVACIGVLWGYGDSTELARANALARTPSELATLIGLTL